MEIKIRVNWLTWVYLQKWSLKWCVCVCVCAHVCVANKMILILYFTKFSSKKNSFFCNKLRNDGSIDNISITMVAVGRILKDTNIAY